ncbi:MAG: DNA starvation/stationary phase protection protein [Dehalococcoidia bacterium]|nr:DNA starvation/stationary phase protection protein [Dehalococcoidia bacterium]MDW8120589.1 DNA starvation/stationary phase protection protein [Chloroflexota bacterium]
MSIGSKQAVLEALSALLASTSLLYLKTRNYHWNVSGPLFSALHLLFERQYKELEEAIDEIAERMQALGAWAPGSYAEYVKVSVVKEDTGRPKAEEMLRTLTADHEAVAGVARRLIAAAEAAQDQASMDLGIRRQFAHEKHAWMLRSHLA